MNIIHITTFVQPMCDACRNMRFAGMHSIVKLSLYDFIFHVINPYSPIILSCPVYTAKVGKGKFNCFHLRKSRSIVRNH